MQMPVQLDQRVNHISANYGKYCITDTGDSTGYRVLRVRDWSLITGRGAYKTGGGPCTVLPLWKGEGAEKALAMLKGGHKNCWGSF